MDLYDQIYAQIRNYMIVYNKMPARVLVNPGVLYELVNNKEIFISPKAPEILFFCGIPLMPSMTLHKNEIELCSDIEAGTLDLNQD